MNQDRYKLNNKLIFIGVSMASSATSETGIAVLDTDLNLLKVDKGYNVNEIKLCINNISHKNSSIICVDLPKNSTMLNGKWRIEGRSNQPLKVNSACKGDWTERFSDRGVDLCSGLKSEGYDVFRYNCYFTKNALNINPPFKSRTPIACKYLQTALKDQLGISGIPTNMIPISGIDAIIGAYIGWKMTNANTGYKKIGNYKDFPVISAI